MKTKTKRTFATALTAFVALALCLCAVFFIGENYRITPPDDAAADATATAVTTAEATTAPAAPTLTSTVTVRSAGDVLIHVPIYQNARKSDGSYNFDHLFTYSESVMEGCDYFVANLETTLGGTQGRNYSGFPRFNSPDSIVTSLKNAGVDCLLTANNHAYDTNGPGVKRTLEIIDKAALDHVGSRKNQQEKTWILSDVKGIRFGIACYTYETPTTEGRKALNGLVLDTETAPLINSFNYSKLDNFYSELKEAMAQMKKQGADVIAVYLHWGNEYQLSPDENQKAIAQKLCDMGVDVIIGGHPHVVQPIDLITSTDGKHKTVCVYSMGNLVSNQRRNYMSLKTGHTEDGLIFEMTFSKYSDGTVTFDSVKAIPTWVHLYSQGGRQIHAVVPLQGNLDERADELGLNKTSNGLSLAKASYERTMELVGQGEKKCNAYLSSLPKPDAG